MTIALIVAFCILLLILAFLAPRLARHPERGGQRVLGEGVGEPGEAPGPLGRWLRKPFLTAVTGAFLAAFATGLGASRPAFCAAAVDQFGDVGFPPALRTPWEVSP